MWNPDSELADTLEKTGIDRDLLNSIRIDITDQIQGVPATLRPAFFSLAACKLYGNWINDLNSFSNVAELEGLLPVKVMMSKSWKPSKSTTYLLKDILKCDNVDIGICQQLFIRDNIRISRRNWDSQFIEFTLNQLISITEDTPNETPPSKPHPSSEETCNHEQKAAIKKIVSALLRKHYVSFYFNHALKEDWQPSKWVVDKLIAIGANKRHIYSDNLLPEFRKWIARRSDITLNVDIEYYIYSRRKLYTHKALLEKDKEMFIRMKQNGSQ